MKKILKNLLLWRGFFIGFCITAVGVALAEQTDLLIYRDGEDPLRNVGIWLIVALPAAFCAEDNFGTKDMLRNLVFPTVAAVFIGQFFPITGEFTPKVYLIAGITLSVFSAFVGAWRSTSEDLSASE